MALALATAAGGCADDGGTDDGAASVTEGADGADATGDDDDDDDDDALDTGGNMCDPVIPGEFNACIDNAGGIDNTLCNWVGDPDANGFIGCLTSSMTKGANVCMISGCVDVCDCFAPPATGTAEVICDAILEDGGNACALDCSAGQTCPDGMECLGTICFWPPAG